MASTPFQLDLPDSDYIVSGLVRGSPQGGAVVVFVPALVGDVDDLLPFLFSRRLEEAGYASVVYRNWGGADNEPNATDVDLQDCVAKLALVLDYVRTNLGARHVIAVGHSMGGLVTLRAGDELVDAGVLWDASDPKFVPGDPPEAHCKSWLSAAGAWRLQFGTEYLFGPALFEQWREVDRQQLALGWSKPLLVVTAEHGILQPAGRTYFDLAPGADQYLELKGADHGFTAGESAFELMDATLDWIERTVPV